MINRVSAPTELSLTKMIDQQVNTYVNNYYVTPVINVWKEKYNMQRETKVEPQPSQALGTVAKELI